MRNLLAFWMGGAQSPPTIQAGYIGLLAFWSGGTSILDSVAEIPRLSGMLAARHVRRRIHRR
jgi:hypothetical protein